jgi:uncharacterized Zn-binding protein involved in type VI secretion
MTGISRVGVDTAGGTITGAGEPSVTVNGSTISVLGDNVVSHGNSPHSSPTMVESSSTVFAGGIGVVRLGDAASCGHTATGSSNVLAG